MSQKGFYPALTALTTLHQTQTSAIAQEQGRQCLHCKFYLEFREPEGADYGVCLMPTAHSNGKVVFEHFGCEKHMYQKG